MQELSSRRFLDEREGGGIDGKRGLSKGFGCFVPNL